MSKKEGQKIPLIRPAGAELIIGNLKYTIYKHELDEWGKFYLPKEVSMRIVGKVLGIPCPCDELVLMTCEDKMLYAYDGEELHKVALSLEELKINGLEYPASESYYLGEAFKDVVRCVISS